MNYPGSRRLIKNWIIAIILALTAGILKEGAAQENDKYGNDFFATLDFHKVILNKNQSKPDKYPNTISREQALDDFRYAAYFLKYGYGGYDYYEGKNGFLWDHYFTSVIDSINTKETWKVQDYAELLSNLTKNNIEDGHFHISYGKDKRYQNYSRWNPYRAGEKIDTANCSLDDKGEILKEQDYLSDGKIVKTDMVVLKKKADYITCKKPDGGEERIALTPIQVSTQEKSGLFEEKEIQKDVYYIRGVNDLVFDPFCGVGTTGVASVLHNRRFIGCELMPEYAKISKQRIKDALSGKLRYRSHTKPLYDHETSKLSIKPSPTDYE